MITSFYQTLHPKLVQIFMSDISLFDYDFKNRAYYESFNCWDFGRVVIGWSQYEQPEVSITLYQKILDVLKEKGLDDQIDCYFSNGNIEFHDKFREKSEHLIEIERKKKMASEHYVNAYSFHLSYIDGLISDLEQNGQELETCGHRIYTFKKLDPFIQYKDNEFKGNDLSNAFVYRTAFKKDTAKACIKNVKEICSKHADFTFLTNNKKNEMNGYYCLFIIPNSA